jgi:Undecaprenyl-phosphate galactose phosphotransferase WbaP
MSAGTLSHPIAAPGILTGKPWYTTAALVCTDASALLISVAISAGVKGLTQGGLELGGYLQLWPFLFVFLMVYWAIGLYSGVGVGAPEELRRSTIASTILFVCLAAITFSMRGARSHFTWTLALAIFLSVALVPLARECVRQWFAHAPWWGYPAVIFGSGHTGETVVRALLDEPGLGLKPIAVVDSKDYRRDIYGVPILTDPRLAPFLLQNREMPAYAVFAMPDVPHDELLPAIERYGQAFSHVVVVPELTDFASLWVRPKSLGGMLGLEIRQQAFSRGYQMSKRALDLLLCGLGAVFILPLCAFIAAWIKIESRGGKAIYGQRRIGLGAYWFTAWKFRSMVENAEEVLDQYLSRDPKLREEWERDHKLKDDPRVTRSGRFLRKTSLDELPQLWNVLMGDMSLVGPRPIVEKEVSKYGRGFELFTRVKGGLTGLWQVSGRNDTSYEQRVQLDLFYVRNWSVWLDFCILFRTIAVVLFRKGAY